MTKTDDTDETKDDVDPITAEFDTADPTAADAGAPAEGGKAGAGEPSEGSSATNEEAAAPVVDSPGRLECVVESLLFASDKPLSVSELKRLLGERDGKKVTAAVEAVRVRQEGRGVLVVAVAGAWQLRTNPDCAHWVGKLLAGRPARLSRAMLETLAIVAYRQPITRPEIDDVRGVDCGPVLSTLLERNLIRIIGRKEEVGRPMLYGTTPEFLRTFSLKDLAELPTLREFHELSEAEMAKVDAESPPAGDATAEVKSPVLPAGSPMAAADPEEDDALIQEIDRATEAAARAAGAADKGGKAPAADAPPATTTTTLIPDA